MSSSINAFNNLEFRNFARLKVEQFRKGRKLINLTGINPNRFPIDRNAAQRFLTNLGYSGESVAGFDKACLDFSFSTSKFLDSLFKMGLREKDIKKAWLLFEEISNRARKLVDLCTGLETQKDFGRKLAKFGESIGKLIKQDIILDEKIDKLEASR